MGPSRSVGLWCAVVRVANLTRVLACGVISACAFLVNPSLVPTLANCLLSLGVVVKLSSWALVFVLMLCRCSHPVVVPLPGLARSVAGRVPGVGVHRHVVLMR